MSLLNKGEVIQSKLKTFHDKFPHLNVQESIEFYAIFDGHPFLEFIDLDDDLFTCIEKNILQRVEDLRAYFVFDESFDFQEKLESILIRLAIGDRKSYTVYRKEKLSQMKGRMLFKSLFEQDIIVKEPSRETPLREFKGQKIKKSLRKYEIQDKIHFQKNFTRFWFTFIAGHLKKHEELNKELLMETIQKHLESYISLCFEELSNELLMQRYGKENIVASGSYWDKKIEIDLLIKTKNGTIIAGESKWKNQRICKNILRTLQRKCDKAELKVDQFVLCSKSGFSKELHSLKNPNISLISLKDFRALYDR